MFTNIQFIYNLDNNPKCETYVYPQNRLHQKPFLCITKQLQNLIRIMISDTSLKILLWETKISEWLHLAPWEWNKSSQSYGLRTGKRHRTWRRVSLVHLFLRVIGLSYFLFICVLNPQILTLELVLAIFIMALFFLSTVFQLVNVFAYQAINTNVNALLLFNRKLSKFSE